MRIAVVMLAGCGRVGFDQVPPPNVPDSAPADTRTVGTGPWGTPELVASMPAPLDDPSLTGDGLELVLNNGDEVLVVVRTSTTAPWSAPVEIPELVGMMFTQPSISTDGLVLHLNTFSDPTVVVATRAARDQAWSMPIEDLALNQPSPPTDVSMRADQLEAVISALDSSEDLMLVSRAAIDEPWGSRTPIDAVNTGSNEDDGWIAEYGLALYFTRSDGGDLNLYRAERPSLDAPFGTPLPITELNTSFEDSDPWVSEDGRVIYFTSERDGDHRVWTATR